MAFDLVTRSFWSCFSWVGLDPADALYHDLIGSRYVFDSHVVNHAQVAVGDVLVVRDAFLVFGYGVVERIDISPGIKVMRRCRRCRSADWTRRTRKLPAYRCNDCAAEFDEPLEEPTEVVVFTAVYESSWFLLASPIPVRSLDRVYARRDRQNAIRRLDPAAAAELLTASAGVEGFLYLDLLERTGAIAGGHVEAVTRVRVGQRVFRKSLLDRFGPTCAVTGPQPGDVLDAAHLYSFAATAEHRRDGGLLLRTDLHRLFDRLLLAFDPATWQTHVSPQLLDRYPAMRQFHAQPIAVPARVRPERALIEDHFRAARGRWRALDRDGS